MITQELNRIILNYILITGLAFSFIIGLLTYFYIRARKYLYLTEITQQHLEILISSIHEGILELNNEGLITFANRSITTLTDFTPEECLGKKPDDFLLGTGELPSEKVIKERKELIDQEASFIKKSKKTFLAKYSCFPIIEMGETRGAAIVIRDLSENKLLEQLTNENKELQEFTYIVSHDLRAPVRHILSFIELLAQKPDFQNDQEANRWMELIISAGKHIQSLIFGLLKYSRATSGPITLKNVDLNQVLENLKHQWEKELNSIQGTITFPPMPTVVVDEGAITTVFQNLVENAIKFRQKGIRTEITIGFAEKPQEWTFFVNDNGQGIEKEYMSHIFDFFFHTKSDTEGAGMGLPIVKKIVERFGGTIKGESEKGAGSQFIFSIKKLNPLTSSKSGNE